MGIFVAKIKEQNCWLKLADQVLNDDYTNIDLEDAIIYDPNNDMAHQWFKLPEFSTKPSFLPLLTDFDVAELDSLTRAQYDDIEFIAFVENHRVYMQKVSKSSFLAKKWFAWNGQVLDYQIKENVIYVNPIPNCIYDMETDDLFFMDISKAYAIFGDLKAVYKTATDEEVQTFLDSDIVETDNFECSNVGVANRKRISAVLGSYNSFSAEQKNQLKQYIKEKLTNEKLAFVEDSQKFRVSSDKELRFLLYGIMRRYYTALFEDETQVATNCTGISHLQ